MKNGKRDVVREIMMGSPVTLSPDDTLDLASNLIALGRIRHIPIVENDKLVGLVSDRDVCSTTGGEVFGLRPKSKSALLKSVLVKDVMKRRLVTVNADTAIKDAARLMAAKKIGCLPVVERRRLIGLLTTTDVLRYVEELA
jgi:CBS domain-containing protein